MLFKSSVNVTPSFTKNVSKSHSLTLMALVLTATSKCYYMLNIYHVYTLSEDQGVAANDSDSSPPRSRGRGRFEKSRIRGVPRGQSEDTRSTSSQGVDETESSSNVGACFFFLLFFVSLYLVFYLKR